jgi:pSer/pThr/pTyr-binding forkhead associated (FHA) protein
VVEKHLTIRLVADQSDAEHIAVDSARFTIGFGKDNDLSIDAAGVSQRHSVIEAFEGGFLISDCGSKDGTFVNGHRVKDSVVLRDGDVIGFGSAAKAVVASSLFLSGDNAAAQQNVRNIRVAKDSAANKRISIPFVALTLGTVMAAAAGLSIVLFNNDYSKPPKRRVNSSAYFDQTPATDPSPSQTNTENTGIVETTLKAITIEDVEQAAVAFMRRISHEDRSYVFPPYAVRALGDIRQRIEEYSASQTLVSALNSITLIGPTVAAEARREGIEPALVLFTALSLADGGRTGDQTAIARRVLPDLVELRKTLGTESADKSLILVAAYRMGGGTKRSHPLIRIMTRVIKNPLTDRNVWYLREQGALDDEVYTFIVRFLALGAIAESPRRFGVKAQALSF